MIQSHFSWFIQLLVKKWSLLQAGEEAREFPLHPLSSSSEGYKSSVVLSTQAGDGIYLLDPLSVVTLIHGLLVWVSCLTWPPENTIFELHFDEPWARAVGSLPCCWERRCATAQGPPLGTTGTPGAPARFRTCSGGLAGWEKLPAGSF